MEARYHKKTNTLVFGWGSGAMEVDLSGFLPTNQHRLNLFLKALNDNIDHTPWGSPSAGRLVLDYLDSAVAGEQHSIDSCKEGFAASAVDAGLRLCDYDKLLEHLGGDIKLTAAIKSRTKPLKQQISEQKRQIKSARRKLEAAQKENEPDWTITNQKYSICCYERQLAAREKELSPWNRMLDAHGIIRAAARKMDQLERNKAYLSKKLKEV